VTGVPCPGCRASGSTPVFRGREVRGFRIERCRTCGLAFAVPRPTPAALEAFYSAEYFQGGIRYGDYEHLPEMNARRMWTVLPHVLPDLPATGRLLDVGCATGGFLAEAQSAGWAVLGTELSVHAASVARQRNGVAVHVGLLPSQDAGTFDLITLWHVVEHLVDPLECLTGLRPHLAPGGRLFIELPNWMSVGRLVRRDRWGQLTPPEHINFFTPRSLRRLAERAGLVVERSWSVYPWLVGHPGHSRPGGPAGLVKAGAGRAVSGLGAGGYVRLVAS
jgi:SAM-dependent methyltransferase